MKKPAIMMAGLLGLASTTACVAPLRPMSSHTVKTSDTSSGDVLWVRDSDNQLHRCTMEKQPTCRRASVAQ